MQLEQVKTIGVLGGGVMGGGIAQMAAIAGWVLAEWEGKLPPAR